MKTRCILALGLASLGLGLAVPAAAERPMGPEVRLNATVAGEQRLIDLDAASDRFVALWWSQTSANAPRRIVARVFNPGLTPRTGEIVVATVPNEISAFTGRVAMDRATGNFVVAWSTHDASFLPTGLFVRRFGAGGASLGPTLVLGGAGSGRGRPDVARVGARFVVVWQQLDGESAPGAPSYDVVGRRFNAAGAPLGGIFPVAVAGGSQEFPAIAMNASGRFAVAFEHYADATSGEAEIFLGSWSATAVPVLPVHAVSGPGPDEAPEVAFANDGRIFALWTNDGIDPPDDFGHGFGVVGRIVREDGTTVAGPARLNTFLDGLQAAAAAAVKADGGFLAGWVEIGGRNALFGRQIFPASVGPEFRVNTTTGHRFHLEFGTFGNGRGVTAYSKSVGGTDVVARRLVP